MKAYVSVFSLRFTNSLQYRAAALAGVVTQFAWGFMELLAFSAFYRVDPAAFPMTFSQTVSYIWLQQAFLALFMMWFFDRDIFDAITSGSIAYEMVRPLSLYGRWFSQSAGSRLAKCLLRCPLVLGVALLIPGPLRLALPPSVGQFALFLLSAGLGLGVVVAFSMLIYISTFFTLSPTGVRVIVAAAVDFLAGAVVPLPFFPAGFRAVAEALPFAAMQNMPLRIYSGNIAGMAAVQGIALQAFWLAVLIWLGRLWMQKALRKVIVQGG